MLLRSRVIYNLHEWKQSSYKIGFTCGLAKLNGITKSSNELNHTKIRNVNWRAKIKGTTLKIWCQNFNEIIKLINTGKLKRISLSSWHIAESDLGKKDEIQHHSKKEHLRMSKIAKFGCEMV
jgi:hypothetical protein